VKKHKKRIVDTGRKDRQFENILPVNDCLSGDNKSFV